MDSQLLKDLKTVIKVPGNREDVAKRLLISTQTVDRWAAGAGEGRPTEMRELRKILNRLLKKIFPPDQPKERKRK